LKDVFVAVSVVGKTDDYIYTYIPIFKEYLKVLYTDDVRGKASLLSRITQGMKKSPYRDMIEGCITHAKESAEQASIPNSRHYYQLIGKVLDMD
jgi:hypothetical protein